MKMTQSQLEILVLAESTTRTDAIQLIRKFYNCSKREAEAKYESILARQKEEAR